MIAALRLLKCDAEERTALASRSQISAAGGYLISSVDEAQKLVTIMRVVYVCGDYGELLE
jgi:hypothetical protein